MLIKKGKVSNIMCFIGILFFITGVLYHSIIYFDKFYSAVSGTVATIQYDGSELTRNRYPSLLIFLNNHHEPFVYRTKESKVLEMKRRIRVGDKVALVMNDFQGIIWALTINNTEIISLHQAKSENKNGASNQMIIGLIFFGLGVLWNVITTKIKREKQ
jgi:hypothetical protein